MTRQGIIYLLLSAGLLIYLLVSTSVSRGMAAKVPCAGLDIVVSGGGNDDVMFVNSGDIDAELGGLSERIGEMTASSIDLGELERFLTSLPNVERANAVRLTNNRVLVEVDPMVPVARVFDGGESYYINHDGKRLKASLRYRVDVPVIVGRFDSINTAAGVLPFIEAIEGNESWRSLVASYEVNQRGDIIVVPTVTGHVINFGDVNNLEDKFERLTTFYRRVMPVKGWNYYDTLSVKFAGQIVAQVAPGQRRERVYEYDDSDFEDEALPALPGEEDAGGDGEVDGNAHLVPTVG